MSRPNILVLITDQQRADHLGCAGNPFLRTPKLDRILPFFVYLDDSTNKLAIYGDSFRQGAQV